MRPLKMRQWRKPKSHKQSFNEFSGTVMMSETNYFIMFPVFFIHCRQRRMEKVANLGWLFCRCLFQLYLVLHWTLFLLCFGTWLFVIKPQVMTSFLLIVFFFFSFSLQVFNITKSTREQKTRKALKKLTFLSHDESLRKT